MIALRIDETDRGFCARWHPPEVGANPPADDAGRPAPPARGVVEIHIDEDVYRDEWADCPLIAQAWVDALDLDELEAEVAEAEYEPDFEYDDETGRYYRCG